MDYTQATKPFENGSIVEMIASSALAVLTHKYCRVIGSGTYKFSGITDWCYTMQPVQFDCNSGEICWEAKNFVQLVPQCDIKCQI